MSIDTRKKAVFRAIGGGILLMIAGLWAAAGLGWWLTLPETPDAFYTAPASVPAMAGSLVRREPLTRGIPANARAWRVLYTTTERDGSPAIASAIVMIPGSAAEGPRPIIALAHGTTGIARGCAPSLMDDPFGGMPGVFKALQQGWAVVATDYTGMGSAGAHPYLVGEDAARAVLDAVRAALTEEDWKLDNDVMIWGHSQGGHSALWAGARAAAYAPELHIAGVAAIAPASDLAGLIEAGKATGFGKLISALVFEAYRKTYPDIDATAVSPLGRWLAEDIARRCIVDSRVLWSIGEVWLLPKNGLFTNPVGDGSLGAHLRENTPTGHIAAPLLIAQGDADGAINIEVQRRYVATRCAAGQALEYREYPGFDHLGVVAAGSTPIHELVAWTKDRFDGRTARDTCPRR